MDVVATVSKVKAEEIKEQYRQAAFAAYLSGAAGESEMSFPEFLEAIGIADGGNPDEATPQVEELTKEEAIANAERIAAMFQ